MALIIRGPFPTNQKLIVLPSPELANTDALGATVQTIRMMSGKVNTHIKPRKGRRKMRWSFLVGNAKAKELEDYTIDFSGSLCSVSWRDETFLGWLTLNPFEMSGEIGEFFRITLEFEEKK